MQQSKTDVDSKMDTDENTTKWIYDTSLHLKDVVYWKDFKHLSPEAQRLKESYRRRCEPGEACTGVMKLWSDEVVKGVRQFFYEGSLHGVKILLNLVTLLPRYIFEPTFSLKEKASWILIMVASVSVCFLNIFQLFSQWNSTPFVNVMDSLQTPVWAVPFPSVVVCPHLHVKLSYSNVSELDELEGFYASLICPKIRKMHRTLKQQLSLEETRKLQEFIIKASPKCSEVVQGCFWRPINDQEWLTKECCDQLFRPVFTNYGRCYAFNRLPLNGMTNDTLAWQRVFDKHVFSRPLIWSLDEGYPRVFPPDPGMRPYRAMASGEMNGLGIQLYLNTSEHQFACDENSLGYTVLIGSPTDHVYTSTVLRLPLGRTTTIEVSPVTYKTDPALRSLKPGRRQCFFQDERKLEYYSVYTDSNCKHDLLIKESRKICNCVLFHWPRKLNGEPICSTEEEFRCLQDVNSKVEEQQIYAYYADSGEPHSQKGTATSCYPSCNDILYTSQVYYSDIKLETGVLDEELEFKESETTRINVHFYDDMFIGLHRHAQYDEYYFAGAVGGLLSLFLGFSIISVAELIYFVILRPWRIVFCYVFYCDGLETPHFGVLQDK